MFEAQVCGIILLLNITLDIPMAMPVNPRTFWWQRLTQPGVMLTAIVLAGVIGVIGGWRSLKSQIFDPFLLNQVTNQTNNLQQQAALAVDTDRDGLSDYEELNIYKTSPFVADSDSDGIYDGEEIKQNSDPNCPQGTSCSAWQNTGGSVQQSTTNTSTTSTTGETNNQNTLTAQQLRQLLIQNGFSETEVNGLTDEQLQAAWQAALTQIQQ